jgi:hypothetical protein
LVAFGILAGFLFGLFTLGNGTDKVLKRLKEIATTHCVQPRKAHFSSKNLYLTSEIEYLI